MTAIQVNHVSKVYRLYDNPTGRLKEAIFRKRRYHKDYWALKDITVSVEKGNTVGVIGRNGSGKSTLLQLVAKILTPTSGSVHVNGRISALLELGSGFDPDFTGRENVYLNGAILGLKRGELDERMEEIRAFAEIGDYFDQPVKLYSSGMYVRLAFATAVNVDPDILLVDEALAVGDIAFQHRCMQKIREIQEQGKTILFVSHDIGAVRKLCSEAILLDKGSVSAKGDPDGVIQAYYKALWNADEESMAATDTPAGDPRPFVAISSMEPIRSCDNRFGSREGEIVAAGLADDQGHRVDTVRGGQKLYFSMLVRCRQPVDMPMTGIIVRDLLGNELIKTNSDAENHFLTPCAKGSSLQITFSFVMPHVKAGSYAICAGFGNGTIDHHRAYDWIENISVFSLEASKPCYGMIEADVSISHEFVN
jgi:ABC-type polysaccharide/polyol phosphate transport system ATPase subunit